MRPFQMNWVTVLVVAALGTAGFLGGYWIYTRATLSGPLESLYEEHPSVLASDIRSEAGRWIITLEVDRVDCWPGLYRELHSGSENLLGGRAFRIEVVDGRDGALETSYRALHFHLYQALATGEFSALALLESDAGPVIRLEVDSDNLYVHMESAGAYLYEVLERPRGGESPW